MDFSADSSSARPVATFLLALGLFAGRRASPTRFLPVAALPERRHPDHRRVRQPPRRRPAKPWPTPIAAPLERRLGEIAGVTEITSISARSAPPSIIIQFDSRPRHRRRRAATCRRRSTPPPPTCRPTCRSRPFYRKFNPADAPIMTIALTSDTLSTAQIYDAADTMLAQRLSQVEGVAQVQVNGAEKPAVRVRLDPARAGRRGSVGAGRLHRHPRRQRAGADRRLRGAGPGRSHRHQRPALAGDGLRAAGAQDRRTARCVRLSDVASVDRRHRQHAARPRWNGKQPAILLTITKEAGANVIETVDRIKALLPQLMRWMPPDIKLTILSDRTTTIRASVDDVQITLLITIALVLLVVLLFMRRAGAHHRRRRHRAAVDRRHAGGDVVRRLLDRQFLADGADHLGRLRGRRRDRDDREHRPPHGTGHAAVAGGARRARGRSASP